MSCCSYGKVREELSNLVGVISEERFSKRHRKTYSGYRNLEPP